MIIDTCLQFVFLLIPRLAACLRLSRREETWKTAEILLLRHQPRFHPEDRPSKGQVTHDLTVRQELTTGPAVFDLFEARARLRSLVSGPSRTTSWNMQ
jgi:hypothetical protein